MYDTTCIKVLTKRKTGSSHEETDLTICWDGISPEQMKKLAQIAIVHNWQALAAKSTTQLPEKARIIAAETVHEPAYCLIPFAPRAKVKTSIDDQLEALLAELTPEQLAAFLK
jgi:hypothetical protein